MNPKAFEQNLPCGGDGQGAIIEQQQQQQPLPTVTNQNLPYRTVSSKEQEPEEQEVILAK